ncbi:DUF1329 domain-containing protein [Candidatus Binatus sp.]|uniref:DUF1329 domain-containing protein n=1 Tax=Candidatus Binatus sp. TaxID=2811406 RepID=UPI00272BC610|nr:DUF1329 domain-containing protein [Candidatus Binatus sp.]
MRNRTFTVYDARARASNRFAAMVLIAYLLAVAGIAAGESKPSSEIAAAAASSSAPPGTTIDRGNMSKFASLIPPAMGFLIEHGLTVDVVPARRIAWPRAYQQATEQYSGQVRLDSEDVIQNYVAGLPFPVIERADPKAAVKIAYNWHWGPFIPPQVTLLAMQKTRAWIVDAAHPGQLVEDDAHRDVRNEGSCEQIVIVRYMHTMRELADSHHRDSPVEYKQRGNYCGPEPNAYIMIQYLDPARSSDSWYFPIAVRRWRRMKLRGGYPHQSCTYACAQFWWEYVPPKTEAYTYKLLGEQPLLACLDAKGGRAGIQRNLSATRLGHVDCEVRPAYVLEMTPRAAPENILPAKLYLDKETYLFLGAQFYREATPDGLLPMWNRQTLPNDETSMVLADDFYVTGDRPLFFLSLNMEEEPNVLDSDPPTNHIFNPKAQGYDPH